MKKIAEVLEQEILTIEDLINCFEQVKNDGNVAAIKFDGQRSSNKYTVFISFPTDTKRNTIRTDQDDLKSGLITVLRQYVL